MKSRAAEKRFPAARFYSVRQSISIPDGMGDIRFAFERCSAFDMRCGARRNGYPIECERSEHISKSKMISNFPARENISINALLVPEGMWVMSEKKNDLREQTIAFAIAVSDACDEITGVSVYVNQLVRCSSSIGANVHEARYAQSRADFISKLEIALKETSETEYWLELIYRKRKFTEAQYRTLRNMCGTIHRMLIASVTTAKANRV